MKLKGKLILPHPKLRVSLFSKERNWDPTTNYFHCSMTLIAIMASQGRELEKVWVYVYTTYILCVCTHVYICFLTYISVYNPEFILGFPYPCLLSLSVRNLFFNIFNYIISVRIVVQPWLVVQWLEHWPMHQGSRVQLLVKGT